MHPFGIRHRGAQPVTNYDFVISANTSDWNLIDQIGLTPPVPVFVTILVDTGVIVTGVAAAAMDLSGLLSGSTVTLTNLGYILGRGGDGGEGGDWGTDPGNAGAAGGDAILGTGAGVSLDIYNASGYVWGGGGGGGGGGGADGELVPLEPSSAGGGGGGGGAGAGSGGPGGTGDGGGSPGNAGTTGIGGAPGTGGAGELRSGTTTAQGGPGGTGGAWGVAGSNGTAGLQGSPTSAGGTGGAAGKAVEPDGGALNFVTGGTAPNVKGATT